MINRIVFRVDANQEIGYGHLVRCLSIANQISDHEILFLSTEPIQSFLAEQCKNSYQFKILNDSVNLFEILSNTDLVIIDGYQFDSKYLDDIKKKGINLICIDDLAEQQITADLIINPTPSIHPSDYNAPIYTQFCIGLDYALLRASFLRVARENTYDKIKNSLFICFGGSDPLNITKRSLDAVLLTGDFVDIHVVTGVGYRFNNSLENYSSSRIHFHSNLNEEEMSALMRMCEFAILPCSGILLEGIASKMKIISGYYVDNQKFVYEHHLKLKSFVDAENFSELAIRKAVEKVKTKVPPDSLIDGKSLERIIRSINQLIHADQLDIREMNENDCELTFEWANHPDTRKFSFSKDLISWEIHYSWFINKIYASNCYFLILEQNQNALGSIRFDLNNNIATISYLVAPNLHGRGIGSILLRKALIALSKRFTENEITTVQGYVFKDNVASIKTFERFGFSKFEQLDSFLFTKKFSRHV